MASSCENRACESGSVTDELRDACGVFASILSEKARDINVANIIYMGLIALQHRGQESAGIVTTSMNEPNFRLERHRGLVNNAFSLDSIALLGQGARLGIGHTRYSTAGLKDSINCIQPFVLYTVKGTVAVSHNGELVNARSKREALLKKGVGLSTDVDSEMIAHVLAGFAADDRVECSDWLDMVEYTVKELNTTSFSLAIMVKDRIFAVRDPWGNRPLCIGELSTFTLFTFTLRRVRDQCEKNTFMVSTGSKM
uniref:Glutamine amidotransferase type-2 domain-containing protein n=1 Tax=Romanomermis culicivorax TaxID=13658 RepID=A0A915JGP0_ROMCU